MPFIEIKRMKKNNGTKNSWSLNLFMFHGYSICPKFLEFFIIDYESRVITFKDFQYKLPKSLSAL